MSSTLLLNVFLGCDHASAWSTKVSNLWDKESIWKLNSSDTIRWHCTTSTASLTSCIKVIVCSPALAMFPYDTFCIGPKCFSRHSAFVLLQVWPIRASLRSKDSEVLVKTSFTFSDCLRTASTNGSTVFSKVISIFSVSANFIAWLLSLSSWGKQKGTYYPFELAIGLLLDLFTWLLLQVLKHFSAFHLKTTNKELTNLCVDRFVPAACCTKAQNMLPSTYWLQANSSRLPILLVSSTFRFFQVVVKSARTSSEANFDPKSGEEQLNELWYQLSRPYSLTCNFFILSSLGRAALPCLSHGGLSLD